MRFAGTIKIIAFILAGWTMLPAQENGLPGFLNIPFGTGQEAFIAEMKSRFKMKPSFPLTQWPLNGSGMDLLWVSDQVYCLKNYVLGNRLYTVLLNFNSNGKFYGFRLKGDMDQRVRVSMSTIAPSSQGQTRLTMQEAGYLLEDAMLVIKDFEKNYGKPSAVQQFSAADIFQQPERLLWSQSTGRYFEAVGTICVGTAKSGAKIYGVVAVAYDKELGGESAAAQTMASPDTLRAKDGNKRINR